MSGFHRCSSPTGSVWDGVAIAVRPSRLQIAAARLSLLLHGREGRLPIGIVTFAIGVGLSVGGLQFLWLVLRFGLFTSMKVCAGGIAGVALAFIAGVAALFLHASRGGDPLTRVEFETGVLLQLGPRGLAATIRGATTYYDWEHVALHAMPGGVAFVLPRRTFHLLPYSALNTDDAWRLRDVLCNVRRFNPCAGSDAG
jgi:hypothetical protein